MEDLLHKDVLYIKITYFHLLVSEFSTFYYMLLFFQEFIRNEKIISSDVRNGYDKS